MQWYRIECCNIVMISVTHNVVIQNVVLISVSQNAVYRIVLIVVIYKAVE